MAMTTFGLPFVMSHAWVVLGHGPTPRAASDRVALRERRVARKVVLRQGDAVALDRVDLGLALQHGDHAAHLVGGLHREDPETKPRDAFHEMQSFARLGTNAGVWTANVLCDLLFSTVADMSLLLSPCVELLNRMRCLVKQGHDLGRHLEPEVVEPVKNPR